MKSNLHASIAETALKAAERRAAHKAFLEQLALIEENGTTVEGYERRFGDAGKLIFEADVDRLEELQARVEAFLRPVRS